MTQKNNPNGRKNANRFPRSILYNFSGGREESSSGWESKVWGTEGCSLPSVELTSESDNESSSVKCRSLFLVRTYSKRKNTMKLLYTIVAGMKNPIGGVPMISVNSPKHIRIIKIPNAYSGEINITTNTFSNGDNGRGGESGD